MATSSSTVPLLRRANHIRGRPRTFSSAGSGTLDMATLSYARSPAQIRRDRAILALGIARCDGPGSAGGAGDEGGHDVRGVPVEGLPGPVVTNRGTRVGVAGCLLYVAERDAGVEGGGDERMAQAVR